MITKIDALASLCPDADWEISEHGVIWKDTNQACPTDSEIEAEIARLQIEYAADEYKRQRAAEYPSFADQFDLLYHGGYDAWKAVISAVKAKYPKPE
jgi:hypothetical protein